jgi:HNH endonuclease
MIKNAGKLCSVVGCSTKAYCRGYCHGHYTRWYRHGDPTKMLKAEQYSNSGIKCNVQNCGKPARLNNMCRLHYNRVYQFGRTYTIKAKDGEGTISKGGYLVRQENYVRKVEHIVIAERALGKQLPPKAVVHHINGKPADNRNSNLVICQDQSYHMLLHKRARELERFGRCLSKG